VPEGSPDLRIVDRNFFSFQNVRAHSFSDIRGKQHIFLPVAIFCPEFVTTLEMENRQLCKYFSTPRGCHYGNDCRYLHFDPSGFPMDPLLLPRIPPKTCAYFQNGYCRYGNRCRNLHDDGRVDLSTMRGEEESAKKMSGDNCSNENEDIPTCGICLETNIDCFGLLIGCDHVFCLKCISLWRKEADPNGSKKELEAKRGCPTCRKHSDFVISSFYYLIGSAKEELIQQRLRQRELTPCREWQRQKKCKSVSSFILRFWLTFFCRFGSHCHYAHLDQHGVDCKPQQRVEEEKKRESRRIPQHGEMEGFLDLLRFLASLQIDYDDDDDDDFSI
jgi:E3 ubiquitin-protein ligase makorin